MDVIEQWASQGRVPATATLVAHNTPAGIPVLSVDALRVILQAPPTVAGSLAKPEGSNPIEGLIPLKNPAALFGYYAGVFGLIPGVGLLLGPAALIMGIVGLVARCKEPRRRGAAHAWVAICLGGLETLANWGFVIAAIVAATR